MIRRAPRARSAALLLLPVLTMMVALAAHAHADTIDPMGVGDLMPSPTNQVPRGGGTLYETYSDTSLWMLDSDYGTWDTLDPIIETLADLCMVLLAVIGSACVVIVQWIFQVTSLPELEAAITDSLGGAAGVLSATILPSALVVGGLVALAQAKEGGGAGGGLSQMMWVLVSGVVSVSLLTSPQTWVSGVDTVRTVGAGVTMEAAAAGVDDGTADVPFALGHAPRFTGNTRDDMLRRSADSVWRAQVATPWCIAEFGSLEVCQTYGRDLLDQGPDKEKRKEWLQDHVTTDAVGEASVTWRQGHQPLLRLTVTATGLLSMIIFAVLLLTLTFASLASLIGALLLLLSGVFFASLWVIPGRPRQWGHRWFDQLLARCLESVIATLVLGAVLAVQTASTRMFDAYGWLAATGLSIMTAAVAMKFRGVVAGIFGVSSASPAGAIGGYLVYRSLARAAGRAAGSSGGTPRPVATRGPRGGSGGSAPAGSGGGGPGPGGGLVRPARRPPPPPPPSVTLTVVRNPPHPGGGAPAVPQPRTGLSLPAGAPPARPVIPTPARPGLPPAGSPLLRPEFGGDPEYGFRRVPPPADPGRVIPGEVIARSDTYRQPTLDGTYPPPRAARPARPAPRSRPARPVTRPPQNPAPAPAFLPGRFPPPPPSGA